MSDAWNVSPARYGEQHVNRCTTGCPGAIKVNIHLEFPGAQPHLRESDLGPKLFGVHRQIGAIDPMQIPILFTENLPGVKQPRLTGAATFVLLAASLFYFAPKKMD